MDGRLPDGRATTRFYARLLSLDLACPGCGTLYKLGPARGGASNWNHLTQRFHCKCGVSLALGVIAYPPPLGRATPAWDQIPTARERQELRNQVDSVWLEESRGEGANVVVGKGTPRTGDFRPDKR